MPRNVRNFWIELTVDGRTTKIATGPKSKTGGFSLHIKMREHGEISTNYVHVDGFANEHGRIHIHASAPGQNMDVLTER